MTRNKRFSHLQGVASFDVVILGGGINGSCLFDALCRKGYRTLLLDKGDIASGTSQASGMMIWGGILYLKNLDLRTVFHLSRDRNRMINDMSDWLSPVLLRYLPSVRSGRSKWLVYLGLWLYWLIGFGARRMPGSENSFDEQSFLKETETKGSLTYEEAFLRSSDARFVQHWVFPHQGADQVAMNYCEANGEYSTNERLWRLDLKDILGGMEHSVTAKIVVNCAGAWADEVNTKFGIVSPFRHVLSKGVYLGIQRSPAHKTSLVLELGEHDDIVMLVPWGPISMWGPTETMVQNLADGFSVTREDVDYLLEHFSRRFLVPLTRQDIVSIRCGVRPLAVDQNFNADCYPLEISRRQEAVLSPDKPWVSCYGGKLTGCTRMADRVLGIIAGAVAPSGLASRQLPLVEMEYVTFPGMPEPVPSAKWCLEQELCCTLEDYLRRRTNIAQWVPRMGLGRDDINLLAVWAIAIELAGGDLTRAERLLAEYRQQVARQFDDLIRVE
ncbi:MAG: FAD-dependent oxidoreductase [Betaproteobacteria bacterium]|nr:FAD-dependent oxidoreductase [Betaproteobacteria bacterium]